MLKKLLAGVVVMFMIGSAAPVEAEPQGFVRDVFDAGFFYGTFNENPNVAMFAGGTIEQFCFETTELLPSRVFQRNDGTVDVKVNEKGHPFYLYYTEFNDIPMWLGEICPAIAEGADAPEPFAAGTGDVKVRFSFLSESQIDIFNSVNGKAYGVDGTTYKVRGSADFLLENGVPTTDPQDFVGFKLTEIRRGRK